MKSFAFQTFEDPRFISVKVHILILGIFCARIACLLKPTDKKKDFNVQNRNMKALEDEQKEDENIFV